jgi:hypothetical protein
MAVVASAKNANVDQSHGVPMNVSTANATAIHITTLINPMRARHNMPVICSPHVTSVRSYTSVVRLVAVNIETNNRGSQQAMFPRY